MRGTVAKRLRRQIYGAGYQESVKARLKAGDGVCMVADDSRRIYQIIKRKYKERAGTLHQPE